MSDLPDNEQKQVLTDRLRARFSGIAAAAARFLDRLGFTPNTITILGLFGNTIAAVLIALGYITAGGILVLLMGPLDALDGALARLQGVDSGFGAFFDSVIDRYSELVIFGGLLFYFAQSGDTLGIMLVYLAAAGSIMVSYTRARGQSLGWDTKVGLLTRVERYIVLAPTLIINRPLWGVAIIAVLANITAVQRMFDVHRQAGQNRKE